MESFSVLYFTGYTVIETLPSPVPAIHSEDTRVSRTSDPVCGKLGRFRGSQAARIRARMHDMVRIIGGRPAPPGKWAWQVAVLNRYKVRLHSIGIITDLVKYIADVKSHFA